MKGKSSSNQYPNDTNALNALIKKLQLGIEGEAQEDAILAKLPRAEREKYLKAFALKTQAELQEAMGIFSQVGIPHGTKPKKHKSKPSKGKQLSKKNN